ncbi:HSP20 family protein [Syntrophus gentianae]|uniref:HSP20 family protein n=1 Tax=Syntrophus gentianae TaxID=43775 RepID=A0A1H7YA79_9BACT|nr:Hsp20/alpha crystallin family protein [Syntrophus gentianae]SEM42903.1 HSP20 family protein [Syntrophus gentianae]
MNYIKIHLDDEHKETGLDYDRMLSDMFPTVTSGYAFSRQAWRPQIDIYDSPDRIVLFAEMAGVKREDLHLEISSRTVKVYGKRSTSSGIGNARYHLAEIPSGYFERRLILPSPIDTNTAEAVYADGLLEIRMSKLPSGKVHRILLQHRR